MSILNLSLLLILPIIILAIILLTSSWLWNTASRPFRLRSKTLFKGLAISYGLLLILATVVFYLFPPESGTAKKSYAVHEADQELSQFYAALDNKDLSQLNPDYIRKSWTFETRPASSKIKLQLQQVDSSIIIVPTEKDDQITVDYYCSPFYMSGFELTDYLPMPQVHLSGDRLSIAIPHVELEMANLNDEFTISQFTEKNEPHSNIFYHGTMALIIHVPDTITLETDHEPTYWFD